MKTPLIQQSTRVATTAIAISAIRAERARLSIVSVLCIRVGGRCRGAPFNLCSNSLVP
jgi:hypothetical protein